MIRALWGWQAAGCRKGRGTLALVFAAAMLSMVWAQATLQEGVIQLSGQIVQSMREKKKKKVVILDFLNLDGSISNFGKYLSEKLTTEMFKTKWKALLGPPAPNLFAPLRNCANAKRIKGAV